MKKIAVMVLGWGIVASSATTFHKGVGKVIMNGKVELPYTTELEVEEVEKKRVANFTETTTFASGESFKESYTIKIGDLGAATVYKGDVVVGSGYCFEQKNGGCWCDYTMQSEKGKFHFNVFHDGQTNRFYRMGDIVFSDSVAYWEEMLLPVAQ